MRRKKVDFIRIFTLLFLIAGIFYSHMLIFFPGSIPYYLRFIPTPRNMNILVMGTDIILEKDTQNVITHLGHTDAIILVNINTFSNKINLLSIPRDTLIEVPGYGWQKINQAYFLGGSKLANQAVEKFLGIKIHKHVVVNPRGIINIVDLIGGVKVYVDKNMHYVDKWGGLYIDLKKGWQYLSGDQVHGFLRYRLGSLGDIGRVQRQQKFLKIFLRGLATPQMIAKAPWVLGIARKNIKTDLTLKEITIMLNYVRFLSKEDINMTLLPGRFAIGEYNTSIWLADMDRTEDILNKYFAKKKNGHKKPYEKPASSISIVNNTNEFESVKEIMQLLSHKKYAIINVTTESMPDISQTKVIAQKGDKQNAEEIARHIGIENVEISGTGDIWSDFTIIVCKDWKERYLSKINK